MRSTIGIVILVGLLLTLWRLWPAAALEAAREPTLSGSADDSAVKAPVSKANALRVLFVGNSHTYYNSMPKMIGELATAAAELRPLEFVMEVNGGANLAQHLAKGRVGKHLGKGRWDYVVLQEQQQRPSFTFDPQSMEQQFFAPARTLDVIVRAAGAKTVFFMNWARRDGDASNVPNDTYEQMQERTRAGYANIAGQVDATVAPVGLAWSWVRRERPDLALWREDGSHAALPGSYLAACVFYSVLYGRSPVGNRYTAGLPQDDARLLQRAADASLRL